ncbi:MAG: hypothetical protein PVI50_01945, partial [Gammaproteobacteria bacterium]
MSRVFFIVDAGGEHRATESDFPLCVGGSAHAGVVLPGVPGDAILAYLALADGHVYLQPADDAPELFHNHERIAGSIWLKSGDQVQLGESVLHWKVQGDQVSITLRPRTAEPELTPPVAPPPGRDAPTPAAAGSPAPV